MKNIDWTLHCSRMLPIHVGKSPLQLSLTFQTSGRLCSGLMWVAWADIMVYRKNIEKARYVLVNCTVSFAGFGPRTSRIAVN